jgi:hypothetical protein
MAAAACPPYCCPESPKQASGQQGLPGFKRQEEADVGSYCRCLLSVLEGFEELSQLEKQALSHSIQQHLRESPPTAIDDTYYHRL